MKSEKSCRDFTIRAILKQTTLSPETHILLTRKNRSAGESSFTRVNHERRNVALQENRMLTELIFPMLKRSICVDNRYSDEYFISDFSKKKPRTSFTKDQVAALEERFRFQRYLSSAERVVIASELRMSDVQVKTWFQNRRTKWRRQAEHSKLISKCKDHIEEQPGHSTTWI